MCFCAFCNNFPEYSYCDFQRGVLNVFLSSSSFVPALGPPLFTHPRRTGVKRLFFVLCLTPLASNIGSPTWNFWARALWNFPGFRHGFALVDLTGVYRHFLFLNVKWIGSYLWAGYGGLLFQMLESWHQCFWLEAGRCQCKRKALRLRNVEYQLNWAERAIAEEGLLLEWKIVQVVINVLWMEKHLWLELFRWLWWGILVDGKESEKSKKNSCLELRLKSDKSRIASLESCQTWRQYDNETFRVALAMSWLL